jgi:hypothetical protein
MLALLWRAPRPHNSVFNVSTIQLLAFVLGGAMIHAPAGDSITSHA